MPPQGPALPIGCGGGSGGRGGPGTAGCARLGWGAMLLGLRRLLGPWRLPRRAAAAPPARAYRGEAVAAVGSRPDAGSALYQVGRGPAPSARRAAGRGGEAPAGGVGLGAGSGAEPRAPAGVRGWLPAARPRRGLAHPGPLACRPSRPAPARGSEPSASAPCW